MKARLIKSFLAALAVLAPGWAGAIELDFYTYNGFEETVAAFERVALVLNDNGFLIFAAIFAVLGVVIGGIATATRGLQGQTINPIAFLIPVALGVALFRGLVLPTGTLFIYDPVRNATQAVGDVPDIIVLLAGGLNKIERGIIEIVDTASANLYSEDGGATDFSLVLSAWDTRNADVNLERTLANYYTDCGLPAMALGTGGASTGELKRNSPDLFNTFARWNSTALSTVYYPGPGDTAITGTCAETWTHLSPLLSNPTLFATLVQSACAQAGFDSASALQMARCESELTNATRLYGVTAGSSLPFIRSVVMARSVSDALNSDDFKFQQRQLIDRQVMAEGFGAAEAMNRWVPKLRGFMIATVLGVVPLTLLFVMTPIVWRALGLMAGLFLWVALWGICDAISVRMATDSALEAFEQIRQFGLSYDALMNTPEAAIQALGVFGKARTMALVLATAVSYGLFKFGSYAFTSLPTGWQQHLDQAGEAAGRNVHLPETRGALVQQLASSVGPQAALAGTGFSSAAFASGQGAVRGALESQYISDRLQGSTQATGLSEAAQPSSFRTEALGASPAPIGTPSAAAPGAASPNRVSSRLENAPRESSSSASEEIGEVRVTASRSVGPVYERLQTPFGMLDAEAQRSAAERVGGARSYIEASANREQSVFDTSETLSGYRTKFDIESTFGRREQHTMVPGGVAGAGQLDGQMAGARTRAFAEIYRNINGTEDITADGVMSLARQLEGAAIAVSKAGAPDEYIRSIEQAQRVAFAYGRELEDKGQADTIGTARAQQEIARSVGFLEALDRTGFGTMVMGSAYQDLVTAARGVAAYESGDPWRIASRTEQSGLASQIARDDLARQVANFLGMDFDSIADLTRSEEYRQGSHVSLAIPYQLSGDVLKRLSDQGLFDPTQIEYMRNKGGFDLNFDLADGNALSATVTTGSRAFASNTFEVDYSRRLSGDLAMLPHLDDELLHVYGGNIVTGERNEAWFWRVASNLGDTLSARGIHLRAAADEALNLSVSGGADGRLGTPIKGIVGSGASVNASTGSSRTESDTATTSADLNTRLTATMLDFERHRAISAYETIYGKGSASTSEAQDALADSWADAVNRRMEEIYDDARAEVSGAQNRNDVVEKAMDRQKTER